MDVSCSPSELQPFLFSVCGEHTDTDVDQVKPDTSVGCITKCGKDSVDGMPGSCDGNCLGKSCENHGPGILDSLVRHSQDEPSHYLSSVLNLQAKHINEADGHLKNNHHDASLGCLYRVGYLESGSGCNLVNFLTNTSTHFCVPQQSASQAVDLNDVSPHTTSVEYAIKSGIDLFGMKSTEDDLSTLGSPAQCHYGLDAETLIVASSIDVSGIAVQPVPNGQHVAETSLIVVPSFVRYGHTDMVSNDALLPADDGVSGVSALCHSKCLSMESQSHLSADEQDFVFVRSQDACHASGAEAAGKPTACDHASVGGRASEDAVHCILVCADMLPQAYCVHGPLSDWGGCHRLVVCSRCAHVRSGSLNGVFSVSKRFIIALHCVTS